MLLPKVTGSQIFICKTVTFLQLDCYTGKRKNTSGKEEAMDRSIIQELYDQYGKKLCLYLYSLCGDFAASEDLMQETFLKALISFPEDHNNIGAWLYRVARNLCFNKMKKERREYRQEELETCREGQKETSDEDGLSRLLLKEQNRMLYRGLSGLSDEKREVLVMQYFNGLSIKEIAHITKKTESNVKVLSHRGKRELRRFLEVNGYEI